MKGRFMRKEYRMRGARSDARKPRMPRIALGVATALVSVLVATNAHALGPVDLELAALGGVGFAPADLKVNPYGFGLGVRGGVRFVGFYAGARALNYFGESSLSVTQLGIEAGYGFSLGPVTLRPGVGLGDFIAGGTIAATPSYVYVSPMLTALVTIPGTFVFVGADAEYVVITGGGSAWNSGALHAQAGVIF